jgi:hypothetical protein
MNPLPFARVCATAVSLLASTALAGGPADPAQTLRYRIAWNGLPAARATVNIQPEELGGNPTYTVETIARTNSFIDLFFPFRGRARVVFLTEGLTPLQFYYDRQIRGVHSRTTIEFPPGQQRAKSLHIEDGVTKMALDIPLADLVDPITAVFKARHAPSRMGTTKGYDIFTGESRYRVELTLEGRDRVQVPAGLFPALRIRPKVWKVRDEDQPRDERLRGATIWVTDDAEHVLLRIRSEMFIGAITLDLLSREVPS